MLKEADMTMDAPIEAIPGDDPDEVVDAVVVKIAKEKRPVFDGFIDMGGVRNRISDDGYQEERADM
jgi:hypothetical protein